MNTIYRRIYILKNVIYAWGIIYLSLKEKFHKLFPYVLYDVEVILSLNAIEETMLCPLIFLKDPIFPL